MVGAFTIAGLGLSLLSGKRSGWWPRDRLVDTGDPSAQADAEDSGQYAVIG
jgi:hypothetical protein